MTDEDPWSLAPPYVEVAGPAAEIASQAQVASSDYHVALIESLLRWLPETKWTDYGQQVIAACGPGATFDDRLALADSILDTARDGIRCADLHEWAIDLLTPRHGEAPQKDHGDCLYGLAERMFDNIILPFENHPAANASIRAREVFAYLELDDDVAECDLQLGRIHRRTLRYEDAALAYVRARDVYSSVDKLDHIAYCDTKLGEIYASTEQWWQSEVAYRSARETYLSLEKYEQVAGCEYQLGEVFFGAERWVKAEFEYLRARETSANHGLAEQAAQCEQRLADTYRAMEQYSDAEEALIRRKMIFVDLERYTAVASCERDLGDFYAEMGRVRAEQAYIRARNLFVSSDAHPHEATVCDERLAELYADDDPVDVDGLVESIFSPLIVRPTDLEDSSTGSQTRFDMAVNVEQLLALLAGEASQCWERTDKAGKFLAQRADTRIEEALVNLRELVRLALVEHVGDPSEEYED